MDKPMLSTFLIQIVDTNTGKELTPVFERQLERLTWESEYCFVERMKEIVKKETINNMKFMPITRKKFADARWQIDCVIVS